MDFSSAGFAHGDDGVGILDDLRCKRSDGKQWRCTAMSMPDKTVCEKHYIQAKKRAANSALRASLKKARSKSGGGSPIYLESKSDDKDVSPMDADVLEYPVSSPRMKPNDRFVKSDIVTSPESLPLKNLHVRQPLNDLNPEDDMQEDSGHYDECERSYRVSPSYAVEASNMSQKSLDYAATGTSEDHTDADTDSSSDTGGLICHQCRRTDRGSVIWCLKCDRRGYCGSCISSRYPNIPLEEIQRMCPACRGCCNCKVCSRVDNLLKARIRDISVLDKLQYLYCLLSSVLPIVKWIHQQQCAEVELEKKLRGVEVDLERRKLNADEQMCCDCCRVPIIDYHRHCSSCTYDLCLSCCQDLRETTLDSVEDGTVDHYGSDLNFSGENSKDQQASPKHRMFFSAKFPGWRANTDGSVPCLPSEHGGCGFSYLTLQRIFKMNWVAKLVKKLEEMVSGCKVNDISIPSGTVLLKSRSLQCANRKDSDDNFLYCPSAQDINSDGVNFFRKHWAKGEPVLVKQVCDVPSSISWDPMVIWRDICVTSDEKINAADKLVKTVDCLDWSEVEIKLGLFMKGYSEGRIHESGRPQLLKLKDWPSPSASEEFFLHQRPEFISKVPFLEFIHSKWGLLNVAAKLPHYSLQNDVGPKIFISYGLSEELGKGDSVANLHTNMRDMVYVLVHSCEVKNNGWQHQTIDKMEKAFGNPEAEDSSAEPCRGLNEGYLSINGVDRQEVCRAKLDINLSEPLEEAEGESIDPEHESREGGIYSNTRPGIIWDVFRREDISKLIKYLRAHRKEFGKSDTEHDNLVANPIYDDVVYLRSHHKTILKEEFGVEPWTFEQHLGQAVFVPAGCPFQVRNLQSTVQLGLDFLSPESLEQALKLSEEIRSLPNDHATKLQMVEVGKISLYAASSAIKEVQKLVLDQKLGAELVFEDRNLTAMVSENLEKVIKQRRIACA